MGTEIYTELSAGLIDFIAASPSRYHAISGISTILDEQGFSELKECEEWKDKLFAGGKYYVTRNQSSVIAFKIGEERTAGFNIIACHSDSPTFRIKPNAELETLERYIRLNTEKYGGMLMSTWLDRPLSAAGRIVAANGNTLTSKLVNIDKNLLLIPNVAIHMMRNANEGMSYNAQTDMLPLMGSIAAKGQLLKLTADAAGVEPESIISEELFLYNRMRGISWGANDEYISAPQLDDLQCAYAALMGFISCSNPENISVLCVLDNEEVGSGTKQGADSDFLRRTVERICKSLNVSISELMPSSFVISADNAHAIHPNHPEYADQSNRPTINNGIVIKFNGNQRYATDAVSEAVFKTICRSAKVPTQTFSNRSDMAGGSTLGNISTSQLSVNTVDIGLAQLAMHSSYETSGALDTLYLKKAATAFYNTVITSIKDGELSLKTLSTSKQ